MIDLDWEAWGNFASVSGVLGFGLSLWLAWRGHRRNAREDLIKEIRGDESRKHLIDRHHNTRLQRYYTWLQNCFVVLNNWYGQKWSIQTFATSLTLAYIYPIIAFLIAWVVTDQNMIGKIVVLTYKGDFYTRTFYALVFICILIFFALYPHFIIDSEPKIQKFFKPKLLNWPLRSLMNFRSKIFEKGMSALILFIFWLPVIAAMTQLPYILNTPYPIIWALIFSGFAISYIRDITSAFAFLALFFFFVISHLFFGDLGDVYEEAFYGDLGIMQSFALLGLILPLINAFADFFSISITRRLLEYTYRSRYTAWRLILLVALDFLLGLFALTLLLLGLVGLLELWAVWGTPIFDWRAYWEGAVNDRKDGIVLWIMCLTTLLPTLVHAAWALVLWLFASPRSTRHAVREMQDWNDKASEANKVSSAMAIAKSLQTGQTVQVVRFAVFFVLLASGALWLEIFSLTTLSAYFAGS